MIEASETPGYFCVGVTRVLKTVRNLESDVMKNWNEKNLQIFGHV